MIGPKHRIPEVRWAEKLSPPRPLLELNGYLYGPPVRRGATASLAWIFDHDPDAALRCALERAEADGAGTLYVGGPPGNYLVSGADTKSLRWFRARGFSASRGHVDLLVDPRDARPDARVAAPDDLGASLDFIEQTFGGHWRDESARAAARGGLWITRDAQGLTGFVAAGGNNADAGTFGPVGVAQRARGRGLGEALARTALHHLAAQGFATVTVPWVERELIPFYKRVAPVLSEARRVRLARHLSTDAGPG